MAAVALFGIAFALTSNTGSDLPAQTRTVKVTGSALPAYTASGADAAVGRKMPELSGQTFEGEALAIAPTGTPKVVMFLAHWCPHCQNEVRALTPYLEENGVPEGVELVSVSTSVDRAKGNYPPSTWLEEAGWPVPILVDDARSTAGTAVGVESYPFWLFVDGDGTVAGRFAGEMSIADFEAAIDRLRNSG